MLERGAAYRCFCTAAELEQRRREAEARGEAFRYDRRCDRIAPADVERRVAAGDGFTVRFRVPEGSTSWNDAVHGEITFPNKDLDDLIILRSDRTPIYNLAVVSDDIAMGITLVMRGDDHISNTPKQILLYRALGAPLPRFAHLPMIHGTDGKKLSKRHGATAVGDYQHEGILPQTMANFLALLGWSPGGDRELMSTREMIELFSEDGLLKKAAVFDPKKLEWMNGQYLSSVPIDVLEPIVAPLIEAAGLATRSELLARHDWWLMLLELLRVRARTTHDIVRQATAYFREEISYDPDAVAKQWKDRDVASRALASLRGVLADVDWNAEAMEDATRRLAETLGVGAGKLFQPLRVALTGTAASPGIFDVLLILGRERSLRRIDMALEFLRTARP
jgi:glutamyl-tRNA synthetase